MNSNKILALGSADKQDSLHLDETFKLYSYMLESKVFKRAFDQIQNKEKVTGIVLDGDIKTSNILEEKYFPTKVYKDQNLLSLCWTNLPFFWIIFYFLILQLLATFVL